MGVLDGGSTRRNGYLHSSHLLEKRGKLAWTDCQRDVERSLSHEGALVGYLHVVRRSAAREQGIARCQRSHQALVRGFRRS